MSGKLNIFKLGQGGVNLVKDPLHLSDDEVTQSQNAELQSDVNIGGDGALSKRSGLSTLTGSALSGSILGMFGIPILTTYVRTLYAARGTQNSSTFATTTNGTSFSTTTTPLQMAVQSDWTDENGARDAHRIAAFKNLIAYPGNSYTKATDNPEISIFDGTTGTLVQRIPLGPSGNGVAYAITDMITANGIIYMGVHDPGGSGANLCGRVMSYDPITGQLLQVMNSFGPGTSEISGGYPSALAFYQDQLYVGLNGSTTTDGIGKIVRGYPSIGTTWTTDVSNLTSHISSLCTFNGDLYAGGQSSVSAAAKVSKRTASTAAWTTVYTNAAAAGDNGHMASLIVYGSALYAVEYSTQGGNRINIKKSVDGAVWTTDRDVVSVDSGTTQLPGNAIILGSDLFYAFRCTTSDSTADGFLMRLSAGSWSKVSAAANYNGPLAVLVTRT